MSKSILRLSQQSKNPPTMQEEESKRAMAKGSHGIRWEMGQGSRAEAFLMALAMRDRSPHRVVVMKCGCQ